MYLPQKGQIITLYSPFPNPTPRFQRPHSHFPNPTSCFQTSHRHFPNPTSLFQTSHSHFPYAHCAIAPRKIAIPCPLMRKTRLLIGKVYPSFAQVCPYHIKAHVFPEEIWRYEKRFLFLPMTEHRYAYSGKRYFCM